MSTYDCISKKTICCESEQKTTSIDQVGLQDTRLICSTDSLNCLTTVSSGVTDTEREFNKVTVIGRGIEEVSRSLDVGFRG